MRVPVAVIDLVVDEPIKTSPGERTSAQKPPSSQGGKGPLVPRTGPTELQKRVPVGEIRLSAPKKSQGQYELALATLSTLMSLAKKSLGNILRYDNLRKTR
jgi:hypothetical protein